MNIGYAGLLVLFVLNININNQIKLHGIQNDELFSLNQVADSVLVDQFTDSAWLNRDKNPLKALEFGLFALNLAKEKKLKYKIPNIYNYLGVISRNLQNYPQALDYFNLAEEASIQIMDSLSYGYSQNNIGDIHIRLENYDTSLVFLKNAEKVFKELNCVEGLAYNYNQMSLLYRNLKDYHRAIEFQNLSLNYRKLRNDTRGFVASLQNIGEINILMGDTQKGFEMLKKGLQHSKENKDTIGIVRSYFIIGRNYISIDKNQIGLRYLKKANQLALKENELAFVSVTSSALYKYYYKNGLYKKALSYYALMKESEDKLFQEKV